MSYPHTPRRGRISRVLAHAPLGDSMKRALVILLEDGSLNAEQHRWRSPKCRAVINQTLYSLYDRYLVKIVVESRHRKRHTALLTDIGRHAATNIQREEIEQRIAANSPSNAGRISEASARFIVEVTS